MMTRTALAACLLALTAVPAAAQTPDPGRGRDVALRWCARCHVVAKDQKKPAIDAAPTFAEIAANPRMTRARLLAILGSPHSKMPTQVLTRRDIGDVISYIESQKK